MRFRPLFCSSRQSDSEPPDPSSGSIPLINISHASYQLSALVAKGQAELAVIRTRPELEAAKARLVGPNGELTALMKQMGTVPKEQRPAMGKLINETKAACTGELDAALARIEAEAELAAQVGPAVDPTLPSPDAGPGTYHPLTLVREEMCRILRKVGFAVADGPEVETEYYCFRCALHPRRSPGPRCSGHLLFAAGNAQFGECQQTDPPENVPAAHPYLVGADPHHAQGSAAHPHRVARPGLSARHHRRHAFGEFPSARMPLRGQERHGARPEGAARLHLHLALLGKDTKTRFRPHYFGYTEPSFEVDLSARHLPKVNKEWIEIGGCGMVDPPCFRRGGLRPRGSGPATPSAWASNASRCCSTASMTSGISTKTISVSSGSSPERPITALRTSPVGNSKTLCP